MIISFLYGYFCFNCKYFSLHACKFIIDQYIQWVLKSCPHQEALFTKTCHLVRLLENMLSWELFNTTSYTYNHQSWYKSTGSFSFSFLIEIYLFTSKMNLTTHFPISDPMIKHQNFRGISSWVGWNFFSAPTLT